MENKKLWCVEVTKENQEELNNWRRENAKFHLRNELSIGYTLLEEHPSDNSYYWSGEIKEFLNDFEYNKLYYIIDINEFRKLTNKSMYKDITITKEQFLQNYHLLCEKWRKIFKDEYLDKLLLEGECSISGKHIEMMGKELTNSLQKKAFEELFQPEYSWDDLEYGEGIQTQNKLMVKIYDLWVDINNPGDTYNKSCTWRGTLVKIKNVEVEPKQ